MESVEGLAPGLKYVFVASSMFFRRLFLDRPNTMVMLAYFFIGHCLSTRHFKPKRRSPVKLFETRGRARLP